jgi:hypothetical protein
MLLNQMMILAKIITIRQRIQKIHQTKFEQHTRLLLQKLKHII